MKHLVMFSGGIGSWATAKRVVSQYGTSDVTLLFADTNMEDPDLYRFIDEASADIGVPITKIEDGRNVWEVFYDGHCIGNGKVDLCSRILKRDLLDKWRDSNCDPLDTTVYIGIDWTEKHRIERVHKFMENESAEGRPCWNYQAPLCAPPYPIKSELLSELKSAGIEIPYLYKLGFAHNNCGGFCIKAGQKQFALLLRTMPARYAWHEAQEERVRALQESLGIVPSSVLYHRRGGRGRVNVTMREFREEIERGTLKLEDSDLASGCGCGV